MAAPTRPPPSPYSRGCAVTSVVETNDIIGNNHIDTKRLLLKSVSFA